MNEKKIVKRTEEILQQCQNIKHSIYLRLIKNAVSRARPAVTLADYVQLRLLEPLTDIAYLR